MKKILLLLPLLLLFVSLTALHAESNEDEGAIGDLKLRQQAFQKDFEVFYEKLERLAKKYDETDPVKAGICRDAIKYVREELVPNMFKRLQQLVAERKLNIAQEEIDKITSSLVEILSILEGTRNIEDKISQVEEYMKSIEDMIEKQKEIMEETEKAKKAKEAKEAEGKEGEGKEGEAKEGEGEEVDPKLPKEQKRPFQESQRGW